VVICIPQGKTYLHSAQADQVPISTFTQKPLFRGHKVLLNPVVNLILFTFLAAFGIVNPIYFSLEILDFVSSIPLFPEFPPISMTVTAPFQLLYCIPVFHLFPSL
jgi:hypothetical protein